MFAVIVFPVKPTNKEYPYFKSPKKVLEIEDDEALDCTAIIKGVYYLKHHLNDMDELSDKELVEYYNKLSTPKVLISSRKSGKGYSTENKDYYVRIIRRKKL